MTGPTHVLFGVTTGIVLCRALSLEIDSIGVLCLFLGALAPDIDADSGSITKPGRLFQGFLPRGLAKLLDELGTVVSRVAQTISGHRGFFHTPIVGLAILAAAIFFSLPRLEWFAAGYLSHILADACTKRGVPLLWPLRGTEYSFLPVRTGSMTELVIAFGLGLFVVFCGWDLLPQRTKQGFIDLKDTLKKRQERGVGLDR